MQRVFTPSLGDVERTIVAPVGIVRTSGQFVGLRLFEVGQTVPEECEIFF